MEVLNSIKTKLGNTIELIGEPSENNILIVGVVHGDEPQGKYLIDKYIENIQSILQPHVFIPSPQHL